MEVEIVATIPNGTEISERATWIAGGLLVTKRAIGTISTEHGKLRLRCLSGGYYWISADGHWVLRGFLLSEAEDLQPKFIEAMQCAGR